LARDLEQQALVLRTLANEQHSCSLEAAWGSSAEWSPQDCVGCLPMGKTVEGDYLDVTARRWDGRHDSIGQEC
jgi:hypothetical protein